MASVTIDKLRQTEREVAAVLRALADGNQRTAGRLVQDATDPQGVTRGLLAAIQALASPEHLRTVAAGLDQPDDG
jgi:molybdopterin-guanine dinucleotide biosynthesis protein A